MQDLAVLVLWVIAGSAFSLGVTIGLIHLWIITIDNVVPFLRKHWRWFLWAWAMISFLAAGMFIQADEHGVALMLLLHGLLVFVWRECTVRPKDTRR